MIVKKMTYKQWLKAGGDLSVFIGRLAIAPLPAFRDRVRKLKNILGELDLPVTECERNPVAAGMELERIADELQQALAADRPQVQEVTRMMRELAKHLQEFEGVEDQPRPTR